MPRKVLISGATGDTGRPAVQEALKRGLSVRAMVHKLDTRSAALEALGAEVVLGDVNEIDTIVAAMQGADTAYFVYPVAPGLVAATVNFAQAAREAGVPHIINLSQMSADRYAISHSCQETYLAEQVLNWSGLAVTHLRPTYFLEWLLYPWQLPFLRDHGILRFPGGAGRHAPIAADDQGRVIGALLADPAPHAGRTYQLFGPVEMDHEQMAAELTEALGRKITYEDISIDAYVKSLEAMGLTPYVLQHFAGAMDAYHHGVMSGSNDNVEKLSGQTPMSVGDFARAHATQLNPS